MRKDFTASLEWAASLLPFQWFISVRTFRECRRLQIRNNPCRLERLWCLHVLGKELYRQLLCWLVDSLHPFLQSPIQQLLLSLAVFFLGIFPGSIMPPLVTVSAAWLSTQIWSNRGRNFPNARPAMTAASAVCTLVSGGARSTRPAVWPSGHTNVGEKKSHEESFDFIFKFLKFFWYCFSPIIPHPSLSSSLLSWGLSTSI